MTEEAAHLFSKLSPDRQLLFLCSLRNVVVPDQQHCVDALIEKTAKVQQHPDGQSQK